MIFIVKNQDTENNLKIYMSAGNYVEIPAGGELDLIEEGYTRKQISDSDVPFHINEEGIIINDGISDLSKLKGLKRAYNAPETSEVIIKEEKSGTTGGHFQAHTFSITTTAGTGWFETDVSFPHPISLLSASYVGSDAISGDEGEFLVSPDTITGTLSTSASSGDTILNVSPTVVDNTFVGCWMKINGFDFGRVLEIDTTNLKITMENMATSTHNAGSYVFQTVKLSPHIVFPGSGVVVIGESAIGGSYMPANTVIKLRYNNISGTAKSFNLIAEYLY